MHRDAASLRKASESSWVDTTRSLMILDARSSTRSKDKDKTLINTWPDYKRGRNEVAGRVARCGTVRTNKLF
ncbi:hypothetical protein EVAR_41184_1 [Eumeta japonica]|uniref:Uncharacterized protein n=1 Tax=Eumeta variegata TaxID=151549 RepID=A0A4C1WPN7_EUMVA|nr:hypothetical protein EVAR_41184_1 [Eumeta japonica]